jgi:hypothetical protein
MGLSARAVGRFDPRLVCATRVRSRHGTNRHVAPITQQVRRPDTDAPLPGDAAFT